MGYRVTSTARSLFHTPSLQLIRPWGLKAAARLRASDRPDVWNWLQGLQFPRDTMILVSRVETPSILCEDMAAQLRCAGFTNVVDPPWGSSMTVGDIEIHVYPFYGEQPWVAFAEPEPGFRNQGNTYVIDLLHRKTWLLIDSGPEFGRDTRELCERVRRDQGHMLRWQVGDLLEWSSRSCSVSSPMIDR